jgi:hypothetical protein
MKNKFKKTWQQAGKSEGKIVALLPIALAAL